MNMNIVGPTDLIPEETLFYSKDKNFIVKKTDGTERNPINLNRSGAIINLDLNKSSQKELFHPQPQSTRNKNVNVEKKNGSIRFPTEESNNPYKSEGKIVKRIEIYPRKDNYEIHKKPSVVNKSLRGPNKSLNQNSSLKDNTVKSNRIDPSQLNRINTEKFKDILKKYNQPEITKSKQQDQVTKNNQVKNQNISGESTSPTTNFEIKWSFPAWPSLAKEITSEGKELGKGTFAVVYKGKDLRTKRTVAIKCLDKRYLIKNSFEKMTERELEIIQRITHPNIAQFHRMLESANHVKSNLTKDILHLRVLGPTDSFSVLPKT